MAKNDWVDVEYWLPWWTRGALAVLFIVLYFWAFYPTAISWLGPSPLNSHELLEDVGPTSTIHSWEPINWTPICKISGGGWI